MEDEHETFEKLEDLSLSQALDKYEIDMEIDSGSFNEMNFDLTTGPLTLENVINNLEKTVTTSAEAHPEDNKDEIVNSRYTFDSDIENLIRSTESKILTGQFNLH